MWLDDLSRDRLRSGNLQELIDTTRARMSLSASNVCAATASCTSEPVAMRMTSGSSPGCRPPASLST
ncbi:transaldolase [Mycobacterium tuberculosis]|nr:transaldolase [Mycobacterium tuberculosis]